MATLGDYTLTGEGTDNRETAVNGSKSGKTAHEAGLYESPQRTFLGVQDVAESSWGPGEMMLRKSSVPTFLGPLVGISEIQSLKASVSDESMLKASG